MIPPMQWTMRQNSAQCVFCANSLFQIETIATMLAARRAVPSKAACPTSTNRYPSPSPRANFPRVGPRCSFEATPRREDARNLTDSAVVIEYRARPGAKSLPINRRNREPKKCRKSWRSLASRPFWPLPDAVTRISNAGSQARPLAPGQALSSMATSLPAQLSVGRRAFCATTLPTRASSLEQPRPQGREFEDDRRVLRAGRFAFNDMRAGPNPAGAQRAQ